MGGPTRLDLERRDANGRSRISMFSFTLPYARLEIGLYLIVGSERLN
jgi:hypothetical protein